MEGPSQAKIECDDKGDGSCDVRYWPTEPGEYAVHVLCSNEDIQHSPFMAEIVNPPEKDFYPDKVCAALGGGRVLVGMQTHFHISLNVKHLLTSMLIPGESVRSRAAEQRAGCWKAHRVHG